MLKSGLFALFQPPGAQMVAVAEAFGLLSAAAHAYGPFSFTLFGVFFGGVWGCSKERGLT